MQTLIRLDSAAAYILRRQRNREGGLRNGEYLRCNSTYLRTAKHHIIVSFWCSERPVIILCTACPELTLHRRMLSIPPVTMISPSWCQDMQSILPLKNKHLDLLLKETCSVKLKWQYWPSYIHLGKDNYVLRFTI